jgi:FkbM family methyltransferase
MQDFATEWSSGDTVVVCAGKTSLLFERHLLERGQGDRIRGFFDSLGNDPFGRGLLDRSDLAAHTGWFVVATLMSSNVVEVREDLATLGVASERILDLSDVGVSSIVDWAMVERVASAIDHGADLYRDVVAAKATFDDDFFRSRAFGAQHGREYLEFDLIRPGDVVIDAGTFDGSTARTFASVVGPTGRVLSFDATTDFRLAGDDPATIEWFDRALTAETGPVVFHQYPGPVAAASFIAPIGTEGGVVVEGVSLDDVVAEHRPASVDFIKMDIEGAELDALRGAVDTIRRFRPSMALSIYHELAHHWEVPRAVLDIDPDYRLAFNHYSDMSDGSVMYFTTRGFGPRG